MATKFFSDGAVHAYFNPYETPYDAFMNYMNVLSDFEIRVNKCFPLTDEQVKISKLDALLKEKDKIIEQQTAEIERLTEKKGKAKPGKRTAVKTETRTSLKELAHELLTESGRKVSGKAVKKSTSSRSASGKTTAKKTSSKSGVKKAKK
jgi:alpha-amylase